MKLSFRQLVGKDKLDDQSFDSLRVAIHHVNFTG